MTTLSPKPRESRSIIERLDAIEKRRRSELVLRYRRNHPEIGETEIERLCDLVVATRVRIIAEEALARLPEQDLEDVLTRFEDAGSKAR